MGLLNIRDDIAAARDLVGCLYLACQHVQAREERTALSAVSYAIRERLQSIGEALEDLIGDNEADGKWRSGDS